MTPVGDFGITSSTGGYSYTSTTGSAPTISSGTAGDYGSTVDGLVTIAYLNHTASAAFSTGNQSICPGGSTTLQGTVSALGSWTLVLSDGTVSTGSGSSFSIPVSPVTSTTYTIASLTDQTLVKVTDLTSKVSVTVNPLPTVSLTNNGPLSCTLTSVTLTATGNASSYTFASGGTILPGNPTSNTRMVTSPGDYTVRVTGANSCTNSAFTTVSQRMLIPSGAVLLNDGPLSCAKPTVTLIGARVTPTPIASYTFTFGNTVLPGDPASNSRTVSQPGQYQVRVTDTNGCTSVAGTVVDQASQSPPSVELTNNGPLSCTSTSVQILATSTASTYRFYYNGVLMDDEVRRKFRNVSQPGVYTVEVTDGNLCTGTASTTVSQLLTPLTVNLTNNGPLSCAQPSVTLTASGGSSYTFTNGNTLLPGDPSSNTRIVTSPGNYSVVAALNSCTNVAATTVTQVGLTVRNPATISLVVDQVVNQAFTASGGPSPYSFSVASGSLPPGLSLATSGQLTGSPSQVGSFTAVIQATNAAGCFGLGDPFIVNVAPFSITTQPPASLSVCAGSPVSVSVGVLGHPTAYQWYKDNVPVAGQISSTLTLASANLLDAGSYGVVITGGGLSLTSTAVSLTVRSSVPARLYVNASATGANTGLDWANAFTDLQSALSAGTFCGNNLREIWVAGGVYKPTPTGDRTIAFRMLSGVAIYGGFVGNETTLAQRPSVNPNLGGASQPSSSTLSGDIGQPGNALDNSLGVIAGSDLAPTTVLDGFVITAGRAEATDVPIGGGLTNYAYSGNSSPTLRNLFFTNNYATSLGGAIVNYGAGGAASPTISNCRFEQNTAGNGGAIATASSSGNSVPVITNCYFAGNSATQWGGAIANVAQGGSLNVVLTNCAFLSNSATQGGSLWQATAAASVLNALITNCSFSGNRAGEGGALYNSTSVPGGAPAGGPIGLTLANSVLFDNGGASTFSNTGNVTLSARYNLLEASVTGYSDGGNNRTTTSSPFASPTSLLLGAGSPAINAGDNGAYQTANGPSTDLAGNARIQQTTIDMGAYENAAQTPCPPVVFTSPLASGSAVCVGGSGQVTATLSGVPTAYQWYKDGALLASQTSATLSLTGLQLSDAGRYVLVVTDGCNPAAPTSLTSTAFSLTVTAAPTVSVSASSTTALVGQALSLSASGASTYQWAAPPGATLSLPTTAPTVSATLTSAGRQTFTLTASQGSCSQTRTLAVTAIQLPDLTLVLYARPSTLTGSTPISVVVDVFELNGLPTTAPLTLKIAKDAKVMLNFDAGLSSVGGKPVQNSQWTFGGLSGGFYTLTSSGVLSGNSLSVGLTGVLSAGGSTGVVTVSAMVVGGAEASLDNNTDADKIEYFQQ
ncbi:hypothetical protein GCM10028773_19710 [Spirosoma koreense]